VDDAAAGAPCARERAGRRARSLANLVQGTVCKIFSQEEINPHKVQYYLERRDAAFEQKMAEVLCIYREVQVLKKAAKSKKPHNPVAIVSYDEKSHRPESVLRLVEILETALTARLTNSFSPCNREMYPRLIPMWMTSRVKSDSRRGLRSRAASNSLGVGTAAFIAFRGGANAERFSFKIAFLLVSRNRHLSERSF
jgi:hypothetical protein